jgi:hypothetical protein
MGETRFEIHGANAEAGERAIVFAAGGTLQHDVERAAGEDFDIQRVSGVVRAAVEGPTPLFSFEFGALFP